MILNTFYLCWDVLSHSMNQSVVSKFVKGGLNNLLFNLKLLGERLECCIRFRNDKELWGTQCGELFTMLLMYKRKMFWAVPSPNSRKTISMLIVSETKINRPRYLSCSKQMNSLRSRIEEKEMILAHQDEQLNSLSSDKSKRSGEVNELKEIIDLKERKVAVLQKKVCLIVMS